MRGERAAGRARRAALSLLSHAWTCAGVFLWDVNEKRYFDFLSAYSAVNQGHCHPRIIGALTRQAARLTLTSRAFHSDVLGGFLQTVTSMFGYERVRALWGSLWVGLAVQ